MTEIQPPVLAEITREERTTAVVSHALSFVEGGVIGPLVVYLLRREVLGIAGAKDKPESEFVAFHSLQSLYFGLLFAALSLLIGLPTCGWGLLVVVPFYFIYEIIACVKANDGQWYMLPLAGGWAARQHPPPNAWERESGWER